MPNQFWFSRPIIGPKIETQSKMDIKSCVYERALCQVNVENVVNIDIETDRHTNKHIHTHTHRGGDGEIETVLQLLELGLLITQLIFLSNSYILNLLFF